MNRYYYVYIKQEFLENHFSYEQVYGMGQFIGHAERNRPCIFDSQTNYAYRLHSLVKTDYVDLKKQSVFVMIGKWNIAIKKAQHAGHYIFSSKLASIYTDNVICVSEEFIEKIPYNRPDLMNDYLEEIENALKSAKNNNLLRASIKTQGIEKIIISELKNKSHDSINSITKAFQECEAEGREWTKLVSKFDTLEEERDVLEATYNVYKDKHNDNKAKDIFMQIESKKNELTKLSQEADEKYKLFKNIYDSCSSKHSSIVSSMKEDLKILIKKYIPILYVDLLTQIFNNIEPIIRGLVSDPFAGEMQLSQRDLFKSLKIKFKI